MNQHIPAPMTDGDIRETLVDVHTLMLYADYLSVHDQPELERVLSSIWRSVHDSIFADSISHRESVSIRFIDEYFGHSGNWPVMLACIGRVSAHTALAKGEAVIKFKRMRDHVEARRKRQGGQS